MKRIHAVFLIIIFCLVKVLPQNDIPPKREFRAVWIATVLKLDWPKSTIPSIQKNQFISMLDNLQSAGINAIVVQVRPSCDAFYPGGVEPWSEWLTSRQGLPPEPYYDPLQFMINEGHKRGMEFHAWFNPFRAVFSTSASSINSSHVSVQHPEWIVKYGLKKVLNPGLPQVRDYILNVVMDVVKRYDIDGVHFDDYFYPYPEKGQVFDDEETFKRYSRGIKDKGDWRRDNINLLISMAYDNIISVKPFLKFGVSPFGKWKPGISTGLSGFSAYSDIYCDAVTWLKRQDVDYIAPQLYWKNESAAFNQVRSGNGYFNLMTWWASQTNGRHLYTGNAAYKIDPGEGNWAPSEVLTQINQNRTNPNTMGNIQFRAEFFINNIKGFRDSLINNQYKYPSLRPQMEWKDSIPPYPVKNLNGFVSSSTVTLRWEKPDSAPDGDTAYSYVIYRFDNNISVNIDDPRFIRKIDYNGLLFYSEKSPFNERVNKITYVVTVLDRLQNESIISSVTLNNLGVVLPDIFSYVQKKQEFKNENFNINNRSTTIKFTLPANYNYIQNFTLDIYDIITMHTVSLKCEREPLKNEIIIELNNLQKGVFISKLMGDGKILEKKILVVR